MKPFPRVRHVVAANYRVAHVGFPRRSGRRPGARKATRPVWRRIFGRRPRVGIFSEFFAAYRELIRLHKSLFPADFKKKKKQRYSDLPKRTWEDFLADLERTYGEKAKRNDVELNNK